MNVRAGSAVNIGTLKRKLTSIFTFECDICKSFGDNRW